MNNKTIDIIFETQLSYDVRNYMVLLEAVIH